MCRRRPRSSNPSARCIAIFAIDGLFVLEFWHAAAMAGHHDPLRVRRLATERGEILRLSETTVDLALQCATVQHAIYDLRSRRHLPDCGRAAGQ